MNKVALAFLTKDRVELTRRSIESLLQPDKFDLWWFDGSTTYEGENVHVFYQFKQWRHGVRGGADAAIVYALSTLLAEDYDYIGLCENDVLLDKDWFGPTFALFKRGRADGLSVGAVSARAYEDRILIQRDGYAVMHNLGAGMVIFTREAARLILDHYRTSWTTENRRLFMQLTEKDIGLYWAFGASEHWLTVDWGYDRILASHGLASLALTPSPVEMIGQTMPLHEQGLKLVDKPVELLRDEDAFKRYRDTLARIRKGTFKPGANGARYRDDSGNFTIFPHQLPGLGGSYSGAWKLRWSQAFGPFAWEAKEKGAQVTIPVSGPCSILAAGGKVSVTDTRSGYNCAPQLAADPLQMASIQVPGGVSQRNIQVFAYDPGVVFYGLTTLEPQPELAWSFDHTSLPPVE